MCSNRSARVCAGEKVVVEVLLYVHRNRRFIRDRGAHLDFHTAPELCKRYFSSKYHVYLLIREGKVI